MISAITINIGTQYKIKCSTDKLENTPYQMDYFKGYGDTLERKKVHKTLP